MMVVPSAYSRRVFVDTSAYYALTDTADRPHAYTQSISTRLIDERWRLFTTNFVLAETHALLMGRLGRHVAATVLQEIDRSPTTLVRLSVRDERRAREIVFQYDDKDFSLTDASSFAVMERLGIRAVFGFDRNFAQYGFQLLGPS